MAAVVLATDFLPQKLRVGLFADSRLQPRWIVEAFARVAASDIAEVGLIKAGDASPKEVPWAFRTEHDALLELGSYVPPKSLQDLDVAFALGEIDDTALDGIAHYGVWRFYGDGVREVVEGAPLTASGLKVRLAPGAEPRLAYQSWSRTDRLSVARNRARVLGKASEFAYRGLRDAQRFGHAWLEQCKALAGNRGQSPISTASALAAVMRNRVRESLYIEERFSAFRPGNGALPMTLEGFTRFQGSNPFPMRGHVFFEDAGVIKVMEPGSPPVALFEGSHPFLLEEQERIYMAASGKLYRCVEFPTRWRLMEELPDYCRDATLHKHNDRWWLFAAGRFDEELNLYSATKLTGPWQPHPRNPVKSDARGSRPAGRLFWRNGALYRPAGIDAPVAGQLRGNPHGTGVAINRVLRLTPHDYAERQVERLPAIRSVNQSAEFTVVDAVARRRRFT